LVSVHGRVEKTWSIRRLFVAEHPAAAAEATQRVLVQSCAIHVAAAIERTETDDDCDNVDVETTGL
jgi:hypothetical protein